MQEGYRSSENKSNGCAFSDHFTTSVFKIESHNVSALISVP